PRSTLVPYTTLFRSKESGLNYTMEDIAELMSTSSQVLINPNMIQRLIKVHGDYGFNAGIIYLELKEMADEIALMPANKLPPNYRDRKSTRLNSSHVK